MGYYITRDSDGRTLPVKGKADGLMADGAEIIFPPTEWKENLVCVVNNGAWDAAAYCYNSRELQRFLNGGHDRVVIWLLYKYAKTLSGYQEYLNQTDDLPID
jgi:hypothetical protein